MKNSFLVCSALASLLALTGCSTKISKDKLEVAIKTAYEKEGVKFKSLACPADKEAKGGDKFDCAGELDEGTKATVAVTQKDAKGSLTFDIVGNIEKEAAIAEFVTKKSGVKTDLKCPKKVTIIRKSESFVCDATQGAEKGKLTATAIDDEKVNYKVEMEGKVAAAPIDAEAEAPIEGNAGE